MRALLSSLAFWVLSFGVTYAYTGAAYYAVENGGVYYHNSMGMSIKIEGADAETFKTVPNGKAAKPYERFDIYATDKNHVYFYEKPLPDVSPQGFMLIPNVYAMVKNNQHVYYQQDGKHLILEDMDPATIVVVSPQLMKDKRFVYLRIPPNRMPQKIEGVDSASFEAILGTPYIKDATQVFYRPDDNSEHYLPIVQADPASFRVDNPDPSYSRDASHIFFHGKVIAGADVKTFRQLMASQYNLDANYVYFNNLRINDADPASFEILGNGYARDAQALFFQDKKIPDADLQSFELKYNGFAKDAKNAYYKGEIIAGVDMASFEIVSSYDAESKDKNHTYLGAKIGPHRAKQSRYMTKGKYVYIFYSPSAGSSLIDGADAKSFQAIDAYYSRDKRHIFAGSRAISGADLATFKRLQNDYSKDKRHIYFSITPIAGADQKSFEILDIQYSRDKQRVFFQDRLITGADPKSIVMLKYPYSRDASSIYYQDKRIEGAHLKSFELLSDDDYARDSDSVYFQGQKILGADPATFKRYWDLDLYIDKHSIFYRGTLIKNSDSPTFKTWDYRWWQDKNQVYYQNKVANGVDSATFQWLSTTYAKDKNHVYANNEIVADADPATFIVLDSSFGKDKNSYFRWERKTDSRDYLR
ncbi:DKNYY domain-containing protein [Limnobaculum parvum]|uniref:DKNYY family protein n=1 Tax=Limnobaculum parvum TaxID=2172103 RepID=A0A2Y9TY96_9GAMM|nr:DKNYY domain-containing protein [Limnobaculum parvum]AWH88713.1 hypothetical protein HYN51_09165 [Limnobaculum parvum]